MEQKNCSMVCAPCSMLYAPCSMTNEQQYQAELLRQRQREQRVRMTELQRETELAEIEDFAETGLPEDTKTKEKKFPLSTIEVGLWILPASFLDFFQFLGILLAGIPVIGIAIAGAVALAGIPISGIMIAVVALWLFLRGVVPVPGRGLPVYFALFGLSFGDAIMTWLPGWVGFFLWLFVYTWKQSVFPTKLLDKAFGSSIVKQVTTTK